MLTVTTAFLGARAISRGKMIALLLTAFILPTVCARSLALTVSARQPGDYVLGGIFRIHLTANEALTECVQFHKQGYTMAQAMIFAIDSINSNNAILPNITLGYEIYDDCDKEDIALRAFIKFMTDTGGGMRRAKESRFYCYRPNEMIYNNNNNNYTMPRSRCFLKSEDVIQIDSREDVLGLIGASLSTSSMCISRILSAYSIPQISPESTSRLLRNRAQFSSFFRTVPSDCWQVQAITDVIAHFKWNYVVTIASNDAYGHQITNALKISLDKRGICIAREFLVDQNAMDFDGQQTDQIVQELANDPKAKVVIVFTTAYIASLLLETAAHYNVTDKMWFASDEWTENKFIHENAYSHLLHGSFGIASTRGNIAQYQSYLEKITLEELRKKNPWTDVYLAEVHALKRRRIVSPSQEEDIDIVDYQQLDPEVFEVSSVAMAFDTYRSQNVIDAVYAFAYALQKALCSTDAVGKLVCEPEPLYDYSELMKHLQNTNFSGSSGEVNFDYYGDPRNASYALYMFQSSDNATVKIEQIATWQYERNERLVFHENSSYYQQSYLPLSQCSADCMPGTLQIKDNIYPCCWRCVVCDPDTVSFEVNSPKCTGCATGLTNNSDHTACIEKPLDYLNWQHSTSIVALTIMGFFALITLCTLVIILRYRNNALIKSSSAWHMCFLLVGIMCCYLNALTYFGPVSNLKCIGQPALWMILTFNLSLLLAKVRKVRRAFDLHNLKVIKPTRAHNMLDLLFDMFPSFLGAVLIAPLIAVLQPQVTRSVTSSSTLVECDNNWVICMCVSVVYNYALTLICAIFACRCQRVPRYFNEATCLNFSMFILMLMWLIAGFTVATAHGSSRSSTMFFCSMLIPTDLLVFICLPKVFRLLRYRNRDNGLQIRKAILEHIMRKHRISNGEIHVSISSMDDAKQGPSTKPSAERKAPRSKRTKAASISAIWHCETAKTNHEDHKRKHCQSFTELSDMHS